MAVRTKEEILTGLRDMMGDNGNTDEGLALLDDVSDTLSDFETRSKDSTDWKQKYEENDATWRKRYHDRFFNTEGNEPDPEPEPETKPLTFEALFN
jgi:hypothetical protein